MTFFEAYEQMKKGKKIRREVPAVKYTMWIEGDHFILLYKISNFEPEYKELEPADLDATDWEIAE